MDELVSGVYYKQDEYSVKLFHKIDDKEIPNIVGTVDLRNDRYEKLDDARTTIGKYFKNNFICENQNDLLQDLKNRIYGLKLDYEKSIDKKKDLVSIRVDVKTWDRLKEIVNKTLYNREKEFKIILASIVSQWFQINTSIYLMLIGEPGCGKTILMECFDGNDSVLHIDDVTMQSFAPGKADESQVNFPLLEECANKTLMIQDLTGILGTAEKQIRRFIRFLTTTYGRKFYKKHSPGTGIMKLPANFNFIFGITPYILYDKNVNYAVVKEIKQSQKVLFLKIEIDEEIQDKVVMGDLSDVDVTNIKKAVAGFLLNKKKEAKNFEAEITADFRLYWNTKFEAFNHQEKWYKGDYHDNIPDKSKIRFFHQFRAFATALCLIDGRKKIGKEDIDLYFDLLKL